MKVTQAQLLQKHAQQKCHKHTRHSIPWRQEKEITEKHRQIRDFHIKQEQKKHQRVVTFLQRGQAVTAKLLMHSWLGAAAAPYVL